MVYDKVVCENNGVWKIVCDKEGVWKMVCDKDGVWRCVTKMVCDKGARADGSGSGIQNQKQEPHTKMWGNIFIINFNFGNIINIFLKNIIN